MLVTRTEEITNEHISFFQEISKQIKLEELGSGESILITMDLKYDRHDGLHLFGFGLNS